MCIIRCVHFRQLWNAKSQNPNKAGAIIFWEEKKSGSLMTLPGYSTRLVPTHFMTSMKLSVRMLISI